MLLTSSFQRWLKPSSRDYDWIKTLSDIKRLWQEENELRLVPGDELRLRYSGDAAHPAWQSVGHVVYLFRGFDIITTIIRLAGWIL